MKLLLKKLSIVGLLVSAGAIASQHKENELVERIQAYWPKAFIYPERNKSYNLYQFETLRQGPSDCSFHFQWNRAHVYSILFELTKKETTSTAVRIKWLFRHMFDRAAYNKYALCCGQSFLGKQYLGCLSNCKVNALVGKKLFPTQSVRMNRDVVPFLYYNEKWFSIYNPGTGEIQFSIDDDPEILWRGVVEKMVSEVEGTQTIEGNLSAKLCSSWLCREQWSAPVIPVARIREFHKRSNDVLCLEFCYRTMATHKTALFACKHDGKCTFLFADSFRQPTLHPEKVENFVEAQGNVVYVVSMNFTAAFELAKSLLLDEKFFEDSLVRFMCVNFFGDGKAQSYYLALGMLKKYGLLENECFKKHYRPWLIKKLKNENEGALLNILSDLVSNIKTTKTKIKELSLEFEKKYANKEAALMIHSKLDSEKDSLKKYKAKLAFGSAGLSVFKELKSSN